jgi:signal peptidase II
MSARRSLWGWYGGAALLVALDQFTKFLIRGSFDLHQTVPILGNTVRLTRVQNPGIAFGLPVARPTLLLLFGWAAALVLAVYLFRLARRQDRMSWPVMLFLAGAVGNSIDRTLFGQVTDFVDVDFPNWIMERWPVFNLADSCVSIGIVLMLLLLFFHHQKVSEPTYSHTPVGDPTERFRTRPGSDAIPDHDRSGPAASAD